MNATTTAKDLLNQPLLWLFLFLPVVERPWAALLFLAVWVAGGILIKTLVPTLGTIKAGLVSLVLFFFLVFASAFS